MSNIRAVIFDFANTLFNYEEVMRRSWSLEFEILKSRGLRASEEAYRRAREEALSLPDVGWKTRRYWSAVLRMLDEGALESLLPEIVREFDRRSEGLILETVAPYPEVLEVLEEVRWIGLKMGILANLTRWEGLFVDKFGLRKYFDSVIISEEVGVAKPDLEAFALVLRELSCKPEEAIMIGDRYDADIAPAKKIGMITIRVRRGWFIHQRISDETMKPDYEVTNLNEALRIIKGLAKH